MANTVRTVKLASHKCKRARLETHYESYLKVLPNDNTVFVKGEGDIMSKVVFVGEAPGGEEERLGKPFVGKSGNLLIKWLKSVGLSREEVFITNVVKHRPLNNQLNLNEAQLAAARQLMRWELRILKPAVVVTLGRYATEVFYPKPHMGTLSGTCRKKYLDPADGCKEPVWALPIYHPSSALRSSKVRHEAEEHIQTLRDLLR
jgi:uracil-DNA glycosylase family 4